MKIADIACTLVVVATLGVQPGAASAESHVPDFALKIDHDDGANHTYTIVASDRCMNIYQDVARHTLSRTRELQSRELTGWRVLVDEANKRHKRVPPEQLPMHKANLEQRMRDLEQRRDQLAKELASPTSSFDRQKAHVELVNASIELGEVEQELELLETSSYKRRYYGDLFAIMANSRATPPVDALEQWVKFITGFVAEYQCPIVTEYMLKDTTWYHIDPAKLSPEAREHQKFARVLLKTSKDRLALSKSAMAVEGYKKNSDALAEVCTSQKGAELEQCHQLRVECTTDYEDSALEPLSEVQEYRCQRFRELNTTGV